MEAEVPFSLIYVAEKLYTEHQYYHSYSLFDYDDYLHEFDISGIGSKEAKGYLIFYCCLYG